jgi:hypothetical protein
MNVRCKVEKFKITFKAPSTTTILKRHLDATKYKVHIEKKCQISVCGEAYMTMKKISDC